MAPLAFGDALTAVFRSFSTGLGAAADKGRNGEDVKSRVRVVIEEFRHLGDGVASHERGVDAITLLLLFSFPAGDKKSVSIGLLNGNNKQEAFWSGCVCSFPPKPKLPLPYQSFFAYFSFSRILFR
jgi:hypothetical protein